VTINTRRLALMRRTMLAVLAGVLALSLTGCNKKEADGTQAASQPRKMMKPGGAG